MNNEPQIRCSKCSNYTFMVIDSTISKAKSEEDSLYVLQNTTNSTRVVTCTVCGTPYTDPVNVFWRKTTRLT
jgi:hypothetical protein